MYECFLYEIRKPIYATTGHQMSRYVAIFREYIYENENIHSQK